MSSSHHGIISSCHRVIMSSSHYVIESLCHHVICICQFWQLLENLVNLWQTWASFGNIWHCLTAFGNLGHHLASFDNLVNFGIFRQSKAAFAMSQVISGVAEIQIASTCEGYLYSSAAIPRGLLLVTGVEYSTSLGPKAWGPAWHSFDLHTCLGVDWRALAEIGGSWMLPPATEPPQ